MGATGYITDAPIAVATTAAMATTGGLMATTAATALTGASRSAAAAANGIAAYTTHVAGTNTRITKRRAWRGFFSDIAPGLATRAGHGSGAHDRTSSSKN